MEEDHRYRWWPNAEPERMANWSNGHGQHPSDAVINQKLLFAFHNVKSLPLKRIIIQYWRPVKTASGKRLLCCSGNPFAASPLNKRLWKYRKLCTKFYYAVDEAEDPMMIVGAPPARAVKTFFPEVVLDLRVHMGTPLVDFALECELTCFLMLPLFNGTTPLGVIEVSARLPADLVVIFIDLKHQLRRVGLSISPPPAFMKPCKGIIGDLKLAKSEVGKALQVAVESHPITLGHVWTLYETHYGRMVLGKLKTSCTSVDSPDKPLITRFYRAVPYLPIKRGGGLVGRTLETRQSYLCQNIHNLSCNTGILAVLSAKVHYTCFLFCLRSSHTGELDYVFEFFWPHTHDHFALAEALLLTLKDHLPSFMYASGAHLGQELLVMDFHNSVSPVKLFPSEGMDIDRQSALTIPEGEADDHDDDDDLIIVAAYEVDCRLFFLPRSTTFKSFMEKIKQELELNPAGRYKIEYQLLPGEWHELTDGASLKAFLSSYQAASKSIDYIKLYVEAV